MSMVEPSNHDGGPVYAAPGDQTGLLITESIMLLSVLGGVGSLPVLNLSWSWVVTLAAGFLTILAGVWYSARHWLRIHPAESGEPNSWQARLSRFVHSIPPAIRSLFARQPEPGPLLILPRFAVLTGILILLPILPNWWPHLQNARLIEIYFSTPAFLVWIAGAVYYAFPILGIRPKHGPQIAGLAKSGLQALSALLLWVYLGLSVGPLEADWMFWSALILAVIGGALGIPASAGEPDPGQITADPQVRQPAATLKGQA